MSDTHDRWRRAGEPLPTSAIRVNSGACAYDDCENPADYLVKAETVDGVTAQTRVCETCNKEHRIWAERYLPPSADQSGGEADE